MPDIIEVGMLLSAVDSASAVLKGAEGNIKSLGSAATESSTKAASNAGAVAAAATSAGQAGQTAAEGFREAGDAAEQAGNKAVPAFESANKAAIAHGREVKTMAKEYKLANMEQIMVAGMLDQLGGKMKGFAANFKGSTDIIGNSLKGMYDWLGKVNPALSAGIGTGIQLIGTILTMAASYQQFTVLLGRLWTMKVASAAATAWHSIVNYAHAISQWAVNAAMYACPIVWIIAIIVALIAIIILLVQNWDKVSKALGDFGAGAKKVLGDSWNSFKEWCNNTGKAIGDFGGLIKKGLDGAWNAATSWCDRTKKGLGDVWDSMGKGASGAWDKIRDGFQDSISNAFDWGKNLIGSFIDGIKNAVSQLGSILTQIADEIKKKLGIASDAAEGPLSNLTKWGPNLVKTFAKGITDNIPLLRRDLNSAMNGINDEISPSMSRSTSGGSSRSLGMGRQSNIQVIQHIYHADEDKIALKVLDVIRRQMA